MTWFFREHIIFIPIITWLIAVIIKWFYLFIINKFSFQRAFWSWWMPSVHSAFVTSLTTAIWVKHWISNDFFVACLVFSLIIIYDAINVRFEAWLHAKILNKLTGKQFKFNEFIWHLPSEALVWSIIWIISAYLLMQI